MAAACTAWRSTHKSTSATPTRTTVSCSVPTPTRATSQLDLSGSLGWQHNLSNTDSEEHLAFASGGAPFAVQSSPLVRDAALVGAHASLVLSRDIRLNLDYTGQLASREKSHGVGLSLNWQF
ncbi:autotransporter domain-containing protein [Pseudomonas sp. GR 6-02]|uniref:autotransporter domain-containing protein n=1 Tax=Pseudomonas sp. GR 6-02 TaxID=1659194 RepID=UPI0012E82176|nr:autotransporter domain-containing protein [Pseudomonas sp. GR 6-02]